MNILIISIFVIAVAVVLLRGKKECCYNCGCGVKLTKEEAKDALDGRLKDKTIEKIKKQM